MQHTFFVHFFAVVLHDYNVTLSETSWLQLVSRFMEEVSYELSLFTFFFSLALIFTLHLGTASISYFLTAVTKFSCISFQRNECLFCLFFSLHLSPPPVSLSRSLPLPLSPSLSLSLFRPYPVGSFS